MGDLYEFLQDNWFELGSLIAQFGILAVIAWYSRTHLKALAASRRERETAATPSESPAEFAQAEAAPVAYGGVGRMLSPVPGAPVLEPETEASRRADHTSAWRAMIKWLRGPMTFGTRSAA